MKRQKLLVILLLSMIASLSFAENKAKYVFYFIGDGMGPVHVNSAEYYKAHSNGNWGSESLTFSTFPVLGSATTYSKSNLITDSSASGTALATGTKTRNGMLGIAADSTTALKSIAYKIHEAGFRVGITSTVGINHATPAAFYGHNVSRKNYYEIGLEMCDTDFEFFGGGGIIDYKGKENDRPSLYKILKKEGYTVAEGMKDYYRKKGKSEKLYLIQENGEAKDNLPYAIDKKEGDLTHADIVTAAVDYLYDESGEKGFFLMSENGKIDWASHANDTKATILEVLSLSDAVDVAMEFYRRHPDETLIVVTADHETGGLSLGYRKGYNIYFKELEPVDCSKDAVAEEAYKKMDDAGKKARIGWTTTSHSAANVPVFAIGAGSQLFNGRMDNTEIPKKFCEAMGVKF